jgi:hypothetical protein
MNSSFVTLTGDASTNVRTTELLGLPATSTAFNQTTIVFPSTSDVPLSSISVVSRFMSSIDFQLVLSFGSSAAKPPVVLSTTKAHVIVDIPVRFVTAAVDRIPYVIPYWSSIVVGLESTGRTGFVKTAAYCGSDWNRPAHVSVSRSRLSGLVRKR